MDSSGAAGRRGSRAALAYAVACFEGGDAVYYELKALEALSRAEAARGNREAADDAWARVERLYAEMDLPTEDRIHRPLTPTVDR